MTDKPAAPYVCAAFINAIAEEGTKDEALEYLQRTWNSLCAVEAENAALQADKRLIVDERDRTFALMLARAEKAEAENAALRQQLATARADALEVAVKFITQQADNCIVEHGTYDQDIRVMIQEEPT